MAKEKRAGCAVCRSSVASSQLVTSPDPMTITGNCTADCNLYNPALMGDRLLLSDSDMDHKRNSRLRTITQQTAVLAVCLLASWQRLSAQEANPEYPPLFPVVVGTPWIETRETTNSLPRRGWVQLAAPLNNETSQEGSDSAEPPARKDVVDSEIELAAGKNAPSEKTNRAIYEQALRSPEKNEGSPTAIIQTSSTEKANPTHHRSSDGLRSGARKKKSTQPIVVLPFHQQELAPLEPIWPNRRHSVAKYDPWREVYQLEATPSSTGYQQPLNANDPVEMRSHQPGRNGSSWHNDRPLASMRLDISPKKGTLPEEKDASTHIETTYTHVAGISRGWASVEKHWNANELTHGPLYFEEPNLERHGYTRGKWQPLVSGVNFFTTVPLLPGLMTIDPPGSDQYEIIEDRPGSYAPYAPRKPEWTHKAVLVELATVTGLAFIIP